MRRCRKVFKKETKKKQNKKERKKRVIERMMVRLIFQQPYSLSLGHAVLGTRTHFNMSSALLRRLLDVCPPSEKYMM